MKSITHENRRRFTIITIVSVLFVAILTTTLVLLLNRDTTAPTNTIEVGKRIDTTLGGGRKLLNASVWDGSSSTIWTNGSGTEADPYLIESAANLAYLREQVNAGTTYEGMYFLQTTDIDLGYNNGVIWKAIGINSQGNIVGSLYATYDGGNHTIDMGGNTSPFSYTARDICNLNLIYSSDISATGFNGLCQNAANITNCSIDFYGTISITKTATTVCGLAGSLTSVINCKVIGLTVNCTTYSAISVYGICASATTIDGCMVENTNLTLYIAQNVFGICNSATNITNCKVTNFNMTVTRIYESSGTRFAGIVNTATKGIIQNCIVIGNFNIICSIEPSDSYTCYIGGIVCSANTTPVKDCQVYADITCGYWASEIGGIAANILYSSSIERCLYKGSITSEGGVSGLIDHISYNGPVSISECMVDGIFSHPGSAATAFVSNFASTTTVSNCLIQGEFISDTTLAYAFAGQGNNFTATNIIANLKCNSGNFYVGTSSTGGDNLYTRFYYNTDTITGSTVHVGGATAKTSTELKSRAQYDEWADFDDTWIIDANINNGHPMLRAFIDYADVTGFDGSGTQADPYQIKTTADLQGMQAYYNEYDMIDEYWWKLINDIDISTDANSLAINWCPIGYEGGVSSGFNGHFDGNGKTISGLTITEQYENVGLFGKLATNATIINLNVTGTINWDQAKCVGGVVGLMEDGGMLTNCSFTGTITGYLNSGNVAVVGGIAGKYSADAITGSTNYDSYVYGDNDYTTFNRITTQYSIN